MARFLGVCLAVVATLAFTPLADAWTRISPASDESTIVHLRTQKGSTLEAWYGGGYSTSVVVVRNAEHALVIGSVPDGGVALAPLILLQQPSGTLLVYFTAVTGTFRLSSSDDGRTWTVPVRTALSADVRIEGGAVLPDGTPIFAAIDDYQADPWTLAMYEGVDLERRQDADVQDAHGSPLVTPRGAVYFEYDVDGIPGGTYLQRLDATGAPVGPARRLPEQLIGLLTGDRPGNLFVVSVPGGRIRVTNLRTNATWFSGRVYEVNGLPPRSTQGTVYPCCGLTAQPSAASAFTAAVSESSIASDPSNSRSASRSVRVRCGGSSRSLGRTATSIRS